MRWLWNPSNTYDPTRYLRTRFWCSLNPDELASSEHCKPQRTDVVRVNAAPSPQEYTARRRALVSKTEESEQSKRSERASECPSGTTDLH